MNFTPPRRHRRSSDQISRNSVPPHGAPEHRRTISARGLTITYCTALTIIAGLALASHAVTTRLMREDHGIAAVINLSGRQRMRSQRIASLAAEYRLGDISARADLIAATDVFEATQTTLQFLQATEGSAALQALYAGGADPLNDQARRFVANARAVAALPSDSPRAAQPLAQLFAAARAPLLTQLDAVVSLHQQHAEHVLAQLEGLQRTLLGLLLGALTIEALAIFRPMIRRVIDYTAEITRLATIDPLTRIPNRRGFMNRFEIEIDRMHRHNRPLALLMLDADHFKRVNDTHGHDGGDETLRFIADSMTQVLRATDVAGRLGGEEFAILLPDTDPAGACDLAERLRAHIASHTIPFRDAVIAITISIGIAQVPPTPDGIADALRLADARLYEAKNTGRNRVAV